MKCETCGVRPRRDGERFCGLCRHRLLKQMKDDGYLTKVPRTRHGDGEPDSPFDQDKPTISPVTVEEVIDASDRGSFE